MKTELNVQRLIETILGQPCVRPDCDGLLSINYKVPLALASLNIACSTCGTAVDAESIALVYEEEKK